MNLANETDPTIQKSIQEKPEDLVDPFVQFEFAGSKIESSTQYGTFDPVWGQKLVIHGQFPSMAEKFVVRVKDRCVQLYCDWKFTGFLILKVFSIIVFQDHSSYRLKISCSMSG